MKSRAKKEGDPNDINKTSKTPSSSRQWAGFRNPRIVRVSRTFGGKDRHSKVCTVRGLRDRRIRLSVPTAIQLYDLQDRLGLNQPSKVVDWLLEATKDEIDKLPPLQMPPGNFMTQFLQPFPSSSSNNSQPPSLPHHFFNNNNPSSSIKINDQKGKWISSNNEGNQEGISSYEAQNFFPTSNIQSSFPNFLNNSNALPYNSYYHNLEPNPNLSLSQFGNHSNFPNHHQEDHSDHMNYNSSQLYLPPFPQYTAMESAHDPRQINHFQFMSSSSQHHVLPNSLMPTLHLISSPLKSLSLNVNPIKILHSQETDNNERDKGGNGS